MKFIFISHEIPIKARKNVIRFIGKEPKDTKIIYITTPANPYPSNSPWLLKSIINLKNLGFRVTRFDIEEAYKNTINIEEKINRYDIIAISGGNVFYFLYWAKIVGLKKILKKFLKKGGIYMGESAGVVCQINDLEPLKLADKPELAPQVVKHGLELTDLVVIPHWKHPKYKKSMSKIKNIYQSKGLNVYTLKDGQVMLANNGIVEII